MLASQYTIVGPTPTGVMLAFEGPDEIIHNKPVARAQAQQAAQVLTALNRALVGDEIGPRRWIENGPCRWIAVFNPVDDE